MAGDWIEWSKGLASRREVVVLAAKLGRDRHEIAGRLMVLWEWADENIPDEDIDPHTGDASLFLGDKPFDFLDALLGLPGFADAMASPEVCWLTARSGGRLSFPKFGRHNGTTSKTRALSRKKKQGQRAVSQNMSPKIRDTCPQKSGTKSGLQNRTEQKSSVVIYDDDDNSAHLGSSSSFDEISEDDFQSASRMRDWFNRHCASLGLAPRDVVNVFAMGLLVSESGVAKNPIAMFRANVQHQRWTYLKRKHITQAKEMIARLEKQTGGLA